MEIADALDGLGRSVHPRLAVRIIRVAAERAVRGNPEYQLNIVLTICILRWQHYYQIAPAG
jgi:hypothetical protein